MCIACMHAQVIEETCWDAVPEHYRRIERSLARIGQPPLPYDATIVCISTCSNVTPSNVHPVHACHMHMSMGMYNM